MTRAEFFEILTPLTLAMRIELDKPTWTVYFRALEDVPVALFEAAVTPLIRQPLQFFPKAGELRALTERQRRVLLAAHPHTACVECEQSRGWRRVTGNAGQPIVERCPCVAAHQQKLAGLGLVEALSPLPGETTGESEQVYPTMSELPASVRAQLQEVANRKALR